MNPDLDTAVHKGRRPYDIVDRLIAANISRERNVYNAALLCQSRSLDPLKHLLGVLGKIAVLRALYPKIVHKIPLKVRRGDPNYICALINTP